MSSAGIQTLLKAEKEAGDTIKAAREYRVNKLKDVKASAAQAVEEFRKTLDAEFKQSFKTDVSGSSYASKLKEETDREVLLIDKSYSLKKDELIELLVGVVTSVRVEVSSDYADSLRALHS